MRNVEFFLDGGEGFRLFDRIDAQVRFQIQVEVEHILRIPCLFGDEGDDLAGHISHGRSRPFSGFRHCDWRRLGRCYYGRFNGGAGQIGAHGFDEADHFFQSVVIAQGQIVACRDVKFFLDGGEGFRLLDGIDAQIRFHVQIEVEHILRIARLFGNQGDDPPGDWVACGFGRCFRRRHRLSLLQHGFCWRRQYRCLHCRRGYVTSTAGGGGV